MSIEIRLPELGDGIESADVLDVLVDVGDTVDKEQGVIEIETDKATVEVPCTQPGRVSKIHVSAGQSISIGQLLLTLEAATASQAPKTPAARPAEEQPEPSATPPAEESQQEPKKRSKDNPASAPEEIETLESSPQPKPKTAPKPKTPTRPVEAPAAEERKLSPAGASGGAAAGPAIRRFAREVGVDLSTVAGTGPAGRITRDDVLEVVRHSSKAANSGKTATSDESTVPGTSSEDEWGTVGLESMPKIRQTIARKMYESWSTVPRVTNFDDADVTELEKIRQASKGDYASAGIKLTSMPFLIKAVAMALRNHPLVNATIDEENKQIIYKQYVSIGIAVDTDRGLVVPALRNADKLSIAETARELASLAEKVRGNDFSIDDLRGSTFTISNLGAIGGTYSTPIINTPEVAILLVGRSRKMPVVFNDEITVRLMMPLSLSYDHRLVDGATAARFLNEVIGYLQAPGRLLLAP